MLPLNIILSLCCIKFSLFDSLSDALSLSLDWNSSEPTAAPYTYITVMASDKRVVNRRAGKLMLHCYLFNFIILGTQ